LKIKSLVSKLAQHFYSNQLIRFEAMVCGRTASRVFTLPALLISFACGFYLPGVSPRQYDTGASVSVKVNKLTSAKTQIPYRFYTLPFCKPDKVEKKIENLGELLTGDAIENSAYDVKMRINRTCQVLCRKPLPHTDKEQYRRMIDKQYLNNWVIDNLPSGTRYITDTNREILYNGFPIGDRDVGGKYFLYNHVTFKLKYHSRPDAYEGYRIVGFEVYPASISQEIRKGNDANKDIVASCSSSKINLEKFYLSKNSNVLFTYDVEWTNSDKRWASRWDIYLEMKDGADVHWFSLITASVMVLCISVMMATILMRTIYRDIVKYNEVSTEEEAKEESGWKLVHGDVFRAPKWPMLLCASTGCGAQLLGMSVVTVSFAVCGFLSPANRGSLLQSSVLLFTLMGSVAGYVAARMYRFFDGQSWRELSLLTGLLYPGIVFSIFFVLNLMIWHEKSSGAVPFATLVALLVLWFGISMPLVFAGAQLGMRRDPIEVPVLTSKIERLIPEQPFYLNPWLTAGTAGILPFSAAFSELFFIMSSIWMHQFYYLFGFLALTLVLLVILSAEVAMIFVYLQLTSENYHWWWSSFVNTGSFGVYLFLYSILYFYTRLEIASMVSTLLYFGYMLVASILSFLFTGTIGMTSAFYFVKGIYGSIKVD